MLAVQLAVLLSFLLWSQWIGVGADCDKRTVHRDETGTITHGQGPYNELSICEWLISAPNRTIALQFDRLQTECAYDFIHVYDGSSYRDTLLASFSGDIMHNPAVRAHSGSMLVYLYSDLNFVKEGFVANYWVEMCPFDCSGHGICENRTCICEPSYRGIGCQVLKCPDNCSFHGTCDLNVGCICDPGYIGEACALNEDSNGQMYHQWYNLSTHSDVFTPRASHAGVYMSSNDALWVYGGYGLDRALDDILIFTFSTSQWTLVTPVGRHPTGRYLHTAVLWNDTNIVVFGGQFASGEITSELWLFDTISYEWHLLSSSNCTICPHGVAGHVAAIVGDVMYIQGGHTQSKSFLSRMWSFHLVTRVWSKVDSTGLKSSERRFVAHSMVYHEQSKTLVLNGGFIPYKGFINRSKKVLAFDVVKRFWTVWTSQQTTDQSIIYGLAYHTATIFGNYMIVYGGNFHFHNAEEMCYSNQIHAYHLGCLVWNEEIGSIPNDKGNPRLGHLGHVAVKRGNNTLVIVGGFHGTVSNDVVAVKLSNRIIDSKALLQRNSVTISSSHSYCSNLTIFECKRDPECVVCDVPDTSTRVCIYYLHRYACPSPLPLQPCNGICSGSFTSCTSCINAPVWWPQDDPQQCGWCALNQECYPMSDINGQCGKSHLLGQMSNSSLLMTNTQCQKEDIPPGLIQSCAMAPSRPESLADGDYTYPQRVTTLNDGKVSIRGDHVIDKCDYNEWVLCKAEGFIQPLPFPDSIIIPKFYSMQLLVSKLFYGLVNLGINATTMDSEVVKATKGGLNDIFSSKLPFVSDDTDHWYYIAIYGAVNCNNGDAASGSMEVMWNGDLQSSNGTHVSDTSLKLLTSRYLKPYQSTNCDANTNCLLCLSNVACAWCSSQEKCLQRDAGVASCNKNLIISADVCWLCSDYSDCAKCSKNKNCAWIDLLSVCVLRSRNFHKHSRIVNSSQCFVPCAKLATCSDCMTRQNHCSWCHGLKRCIDKASSTSYSIYGQCVALIGSLGGISSCDHVNCGLATDCKKCLSEPYRHCGWCYPEENPSEGRCISGDFGTPYVEGGCKAIGDKWAIAHGNDSSTELGMWKWSYSHCPDMMECELEIDFCSENATCTNTFDFFECHCKRGFKGNGFECQKTCYEECQHGKCSGYPEYKCECKLGWTGVACNESCRCHGHSHCSKGIGLCDRCHNYTKGKFCQFCIEGSFGDATSSRGCQPCQCNGHGDEEKHLCNVSTGVCYCLPTYQGPNCESCERLYYGNPLNGGLCYSECDGLTVISNERSGSLGSYRGNGLASNNGQSNCMWIITAANQMTVDSLSLSTLPDVEQFLAESQSKQLLITLSINRLDMNTVCGQDVVYVYDGLPAFVLNLNKSQVSFDSKLVAAYCGEKLISSPVSAVSGVMVVWYRGSVETVNGKQRGFNASYEIQSCRTGCEMDPSCSENIKCSCNRTLENPNCKAALCPDDCTTNLTECIKDRGVCACQNGAFGSDCKDHHLTGGVHVYSQSVVLSTSDHGLLSDLPGIMGASAIYTKNSIYLFGGYSLENGLSASLTKINLNLSRWQTVQLPVAQGKGKTGNKIHGRIFHASVLLPSQKLQMIVIGGWSDGGPTDSVLHVDLEYQTVTQLEQLPVALAAHTATTVNGSVYVIGGLKRDSGISNSVYKYALVEGMWEHIKTTGSKFPGCYGHTAVYYDGLKSTVTFGGYQYNHKSQQLEISHNLYSFSIVSGQKGLWRQWTNHKIPSAFPFNWAFMSSSQSIILGWDSRNSFSALSNVSLVIYHLTCNQSFPLADAHGIALPYQFGQGIAFDSDQDRVYAIGGFNGVAKGDIYAIDVPSDDCYLVSPSWTNRSCDKFPGCLRCRNGTTESTLCGSTQSLCQSSSSTANSCLYLSCSMWHSCSECNSLSLSPHGPSCEWCPCQKICIDSNRQGHTECNCDAVSQCNSHLPGNCDWDNCDMCQNDPSCEWIIDTIPHCMLISEVTNHTTPDRGQCHMSCRSYTTCNACAGKQIRSESGILECLWSETLELCISAIEHPLMCAYGQCGRVSYYSSQCMEPCSHHTFCGQCIKQTTCGWCAVPDHSGRGKCMDGTINGATTGLCPMKTNLSGYSLNNSSNTVTLSTWSFLDCPQEDECTNGHHTCRADQECKDTTKLYECNCRDGYKEIAGTYRCVPSCDSIKGCDKGNCVAPNHCHCNFGYVGSRCSVACQCNEKGQCRDNTTEGLTDCRNCINNTQGPQCAQCKPFFVKLEAGRCLSCNDFCYGNSDICLQEEQVQYLKDKNASIMSQNDIYSYLNLTSGPDFYPKTKCMHCRNHSLGERCASCEDGYFNIHFNDQEVDWHVVECVPCMCNGHGTSCDTDGECDCDDHTVMSERGCDENCYLKQCNLCSEGYSGDPRDGYPCYKDTRIDSKSSYWVNPTTSMLLAVIPQYTNVDVELTIWVTSGHINVFMSTNEHEFKRKTDSLGRQSILFAVDGENSTQPSVLYGENVPDLSKSPVVKRMAPRTQTLSLFGVNNQLRITLPHLFYPLHRTKVYVAVIGASNGTSSFYFYFRQDSAEIDLFIFFSVFFSSFFLFLGLCVVAWKIKQRLDTRHAEQTQIFEMEERAKRPFAGVDFLCQRNMSRTQCFSLPLSGGQAIWNRQRLKRIRATPVQPLVQQPTEDSTAMVQTVLMSLPGSPFQPLKLGLGTCLVQRLPSKRKREQQKRSS